jgi:hypothetical protein
VRLKGDDYFDKAARSSFAPYTTGHDVTIKHVQSAREMKQLIEGSTWDVVIYFGHGVENDKALAPQEGGRPLKKEELQAALKASGAKQVYLFGCKSAWTGLARDLSKELQGTSVYGTSESLDVDWVQSKDSNGTFTNKFVFKQPLKRYIGGNQVNVNDGSKLERREMEMNDRLEIKTSDSPLGPPTVPQ